MPPKKATACSRVRRRFSALAGVSTGVSSGVAGSVGVGQNA